MSRSGYSEDLDNWDLIRWRGQVASAIRGKRGQKLLIDLHKALEELPNKELIRHELQTQDGNVCALGALGKSRGLNMNNVDPDETEAVASMFGVAEQLVREIVYLNDEAYCRETPAERYQRMKKWVTEQIRLCA